MTIIRTLQYPDPRLQTKGRRVEDFASKEVQKVIDDMLETLFASKNCAGLAATQLDFEHPYRITVVHLTDDPKEADVLVNPEIIYTEGECLEPEGCMSVLGGVYEKIRRPALLRYKAQDRHGNPIEGEVEGFHAKLIQHECEHLDGMLFIDHLSGLKRKMADRKVARFHKRVK